MLLKRIIVIACIMGAGLLASCSQKQVDAEQAPSVWFVDPVHGSDDADGHSRDTAWKTFAPLNSTLLGPGDKVFIAPGLHEHSLVPRAIGSKEKRVRFIFEPGVHEFGHEQAVRGTYFISNSVAAAGKPMPIGILIKDCKHVILSRGQPVNKDTTPATLLMGGRMTHFVNDHSEDIRYRRLTFDLKRPTVSEFRVMQSSANSAEIVLAPGSTAELQDGKLVWTGDIGGTPGLLQQGIPAEGRLWRTSMGNDPLKHATKIEQLAADAYRLHFEEGRKPLVAGHQYQYRNGERDVVGAHNVRCKDIVFEDIEFNAMAGMGVISQFTENIAFRRCLLAPPHQSLRACAAWADGFHFSGCRGQVEVEECRFSGLQDDPVNVHGTHLRILEALAPNQLKVSFIHQQTYGFQAFQAGDEIAVIHSPTLREHKDNPRRKVTAVERLTDRDWLLTMDGQVPHWEENDVVDNITWYPDLTIRNCHVDMCPTRGFLITTRGKSLVEGNTLKRCGMPGILIENDASGWFESGPVQDLLIQNNRFIGCGIKIHPRVKDGNDPVHDNIRIVDNTFEEGAKIEAHHVSNLVIEDDVPVVVDNATVSGVLRQNGHEAILNPKGMGGVLKPDQKAPVEDK